MVKLTFLGTGTSQGVPVISCGCYVCSSTDERDKRLRTSAMVQVDDVRLIIDAGPDFRAQMLSHNVKDIDAIILTHEHKDHIGGLDDVRAFNYTSGRAVDIYASERTQKTIRKDFDYAFCENPYPGVPEINLITIEDNTPFTIKGVEITPILGHHYKLPVLGFRIGNLAYLTDFNAIDEEQLAKIKGVEILVVNALRRESHLSHFTLDEALHLRYLVGSKRTYLTHISHQMGRHRAVNSELPEGVELAYDSLEVETSEL